jgi:hypothetical protein
MLMLTKYKKMIVGACLLFGILFCILGCVGLKMMTKTPDSSSRKLPTRKVTITIDISHRQEFFDQMRKFADKHDFTILIDAQPSGAEDFLIYMTREDIEISGLNVFAPGEYRLGFYDANRRQPAPKSVLDDLVSDLKRFVNEVPGTTFSVEK